MKHSHPDDIHLGSRGERTNKPMKIVEDDETLHGTQNGGTCVHSGTYTLAASSNSNGSLTISEGANVVIRGSQNGSLHVNSGGTVEVHGAHNGSTHVEPGGLVRVHPGAKLAGSVHVGGLIENHGARGGTVSAYGGGEIRDLPGATVKEPEITASGAHIYRW